MLRTTVRVVGIFAALLLVLAIVALYVTPWPGVLAIRQIFDAGAAQAAAKLEKKVPPGITARIGIRYDAKDPAALFDIYRSAGIANGPTIVWIHGGGFVSGQRSDIANYLKILAGQGFTVINLDYTIAPEAIYPTPARQINAALAHIVANGSRLGVDPARILLAGDSAGANLAAQVATIVTSPDYARAIGIAPGLSADRLKGVILFCGPYDLALMKGEGIGGLFTRLTVWAYSGVRNPADRPDFATFSLTDRVTSQFPPAFISVGNADPLKPHSKLLADALTRKGVAVDTLFFPDDYAPPLAHEYQFDLDTAAGRQALERAGAFARRVGG